MNTVQTPLWTLKKVGERLTNSLRFVGQCDRSYSDEFKQAGCKVGVTVNARLPQRYTVNKGSAFVPQPITDNIVPITITDQANTGLEFDSFTMTMQVDDYRSRYIDPAAEAIANQVDYDGASRSYLDAFWATGTPGVVPGSTGTLPQAASQSYTSAVTKLANYAVRGPYTAVITPAMQEYLVTGHMALFNPAAQISANFKNGKFSGEALGIQSWHMDQNMPTHTVGPLGGTPLVNGADQTGSSVITDGWTASAANRLKKGDIITFASVYTVNPQSRQSTGQLQQFVVTADVDSDGSGNATIPIYPPIVISGAWQTVNVAPANNDPILIFGHASTYANVQSRQGLVFTRGAFAMVTADLEKPQGVWASERISNKAVGVAIRFVKDYSIMTDQSPARLDTIYGFKTVRPEMAARVCS